jgi:hypothetical protein
MERMPGLLEPPLEVALGILPVPPFDKRLAFAGEWGAFQRRFVVVVPTAAAALFVCRIVAGILVGVARTGVGVGCGVGTVCVAVV